MTTQYSPFTFSGLLAGEAMTSAQYKLVRLASTAGNVMLATLATDHVLGVLNNTPASGQPAEIQFAGVAKVLSEGSVNIGDYVRASSTSRVKTTTTGDDDPIGIAIDAGSAGDLIRVLIRGFNY